MKAFAISLVAIASFALPCAAQTTVKLLEPVSIAEGPFPWWVVPDDEAFEFASKQLYLQCDAGATATINGPYFGGSLIVDNFINVLGPTNVTTRYCSDAGDNSCFTNAHDYYENVGLAAEYSYDAVAPVDVSASLVPGLGLYTFSLMDGGVTYASSELTLTTSCAVKDKVCHYDSGKKSFKTLTVGAAAIPAHLSKHAGDTLGACSQQ
jgi:hypothetical protein